MKIIIPLLIIALSALNCKSGNNNSVQNSNSTDTISTIIEEENFIGSYSMEPNGRAEVIITKSNGFYFCSWQGEKYQLTNTIGAMWNDAIDSQSRKCILDGISCEVFCVLKVIKGCNNSVLGNLTSDYYIWSIAGSPLYKL